MQPRGVLKHVADYSAYLHRLTAIAQSSGLPTRCRLARLPQADRRFARSYRRNFRLLALIYCM